MWSVLLSSVSSSALSASEGGGDVVFDGFMVSDGAGGFESYNVLSGEPVSYVEPTGVSSTLWRLRIDANQTGGYTSVGELRFYDAEGQIAAIDPTDGTASASSTGFSLPADNAFDGSNTTLWHSGNSSLPVDGEWLQFEFSSGVAPTSFAITSRGSGASDSYTQTPTAGALEYSEDAGATWVEWIPFTTGNWTAYGQTRTFEKAGYSASDRLALGKVAWKYWRVNVLVPTGAVSLATVEFRETVGGAQAALGGTPFAASTLSGYPASNAFDTNLGTFWHSSGADIIGYEFASEIQIAEVAMTNRNGEPQQAPTSYRIEVSSDGVNFVNFSGATYAQAGWAGQETRTDVITEQEAAVFEPYNVLAGPSYSILGVVSARPTTTQSVSNNTDTDMVFANVLEDTTGTFLTPFTTVTTPAGAQFAQVTGYKDCFSDPSYAQLRIKVNGVAVSQRTFHDPGFGFADITETIQVSEGDTISVSVNPNANITLETGGHFGVTFYG